MSGNAPLLVLFQAYKSVPHSKIIILKRKNQIKGRKIARKK